MSRITFLFIALFIPLLNLSAQDVRVPSEIMFAGIRLKINEGARKEIQEDVDAMTQSPRYFDQKVRRAQLYFPIIERILREENVPDDIKYLVIQESALISDAVSSSNAVGYWQFKDFTAVEMGLRVDSHVDERMNIVSSTRAAAKYFKKNNFYFNNWLYALQAYQMGAGAALKVVDEKERGAKSMNITRKTYWYVKKYLAHRIAYEDALSRAPKLDQNLLEYTRGGSKTLRNIASELNLEEEELKSYNKWLKRGRIPEDKLYTVIALSTADEVPYVIASAGEGMDPGNDTPTSADYDGLEDPDRFPEIKEKKKLANKQPLFVNINSIPGIVGQEGQTPGELAELAGITELKFRSYNEILPHESIDAGQVYYFKKKKTKAKVHYHTIQYSETLWSISQKYGVRMSKLMNKNRLKDENDIQPGMVLWLRYIRPESSPVIIKEVEEPLIVSEEAESVKSEEVASYIEKFPDRPVDNGPDIESRESDIEVVDPSSIEILPQKPDTNPEEVKVLHEVKPRETLYSISNIYGVEVMDIVTWNDLNIADGIRIGQVLDIWADKGWQDVDLSIPSSQEEGSDAAEFVEYRVQPGDTLFGIAQKFDVTVQDLQTWNQKSGTSISIGEKIRIKQ